MLIPGPSRANLGEYLKEDLLLGEKEEASRGDPQTLSPEPYLSSSPCRSREASYVLPVLRGSLE